MTDIPEKLHHHGGMGEMLRTVVLWLILAVMGWVGVTINQLRDASNAQNVAQAQMQTKFDDMQQSLKPVTDALPTLTREVDKLDLESADHERRIQDLESSKALRR